MTDGCLHARVGDEAEAFTQRVEVVLDENPELAMDRDGRKAGIAGLLQALHEQRPVAVWREHMRVEVITFDALRVGEDDLSHAQRCELRPQPAHDFRAWEREKQVDPGPLRRITVKRRSEEHTSEL